MANSHNQPSSQIPPQITGNDHLLDPQPSPSPDTMVVMRTLGDYLVNITQYANRQLAPSSVINPAELLNDFLVQQTLQDTLHRTSQSEHKILFAVMAFNDHIVTS